MADTLTKQRMLEIVSMFSRTSIIEFETFENSDDEILGYSTLDFFEDVDSSGDFSESKNFLVRQVSQSRAYNEGELCTVIQVVEKSKDFKPSEFGYLKFSGRFSSWDDSYYTCIEHVHPVEKTEIVFE